jgi:hypothetical protein
MCCGGIMDVAWPIHAGSNGMTLYLFALSIVGTLPLAMTAS